MPCEFYGVEGLSQVNLGKGIRVSGGIVLNDCFTLSAVIVVIILESDS